MPTSTLTSKGQITLPLARMRHRLPILGRFRCEERWSRRCCAGFGAAGRAKTGL